MLKERGGIYVDACFAAYQRSRNAILALDEELLFFHFGVFSQDLTNSISDSVQDKMIEAGEKKIIIKRVFSILIEGLQNIRLHSFPDDKNIHLSHLCVTKNRVSYKISFGNIVNNYEKKILIRQMNLLNGLSESSVKEMYINVLGQGTMTDKGGAGLGFITMKMKSSKNFVFNFTELEQDLHYFDFALELFTRDE
jgi:hypothetical protein